MALDKLNFSLTMAIYLDQLRDHDGLVPMKHIEMHFFYSRELRIKATNQQVFVDPHARAVLDVIGQRRHLLPIAKLMLHEKEHGMKGVGIFGVPFDKGIELAAKAQPGFLLKTMHKAIPPGEDFVYGVCATLVTHIQRSSEYIQFEAWQFVRSDAPIYYLHGLMDASGGNFTHLDGATILHNKSDVEALFQHGTKVKGTKYQKWFRLDGTFNKEDALAIANVYCPVQALMTEYLEQYTDLSNTSTCHPPCAIYTDAAQMTLRNCSA